MTVYEFKKQLAELRAKKFYGLNNQQVYTYIRIYYSIYIMVSVNALDEEYGDRNIYVRKMESLLKILHRRYDKSQDTVEKIQMLYMMFFLLDNITCKYNCEEYLNRGADIIDEYLATNRDTMTYEDQYQLMRLIFIEWYGLVEDDDTDTPASLTYARDQIKTWASELSTDGSWHNIDTIQALRRIVLISFNSTIMLDDSYDTQLEAAYNHYCMQLLPETIEASDINKYILMYYAIQRAPLAISENYISQQKQLAQLISKYTKYQKDDKTLKTICNCIALDNMCQQISDEVQDLLIGDL